MKYSVFICDDNPAVLSSLSEMINRLFGERLNTETFTSFSAMLEAAEKSSPDIAILDILLNEGNGCILAEKLTALSPGTSIIFLTGHMDKADGIFSSVTPSGLLFKPVSDEKLFSTINSVILQISAICLTNRTEQTIVRACDILYVESDVKRIKIYVKDHSVSGGVSFIYSSTSLSQFINSSGITFIRCHKSYAVNPAFVRRITKTEFKLAGEASAPISRRYYNSACDEYMLWATNKYPHTVTV